MTKGWDIQRPRDCVGFAAETKSSWYAAAGEKKADAIGPLANDVSQLKHWL